MEIMEDVDVKVNENQISFDFLNDFQPLTKVENHEWVAKDTLVLLARAKNGLSPNFDLCGKKMIDWVALATSGCDQMFVDQPEEENLLETVKLALERSEKQYEFVALFFSDTPLMQKSTFLEVMDYFSKRRMNVMKLSRGFVFRADYLKNALMLLSGAITEFDNEDFLVVDNPQKASLAFKVLNRRILEYHKKNGVVIFGENTVFIDADVEIEAGTVVYPNNILKGETYVGHNAILESGNYVLDTIICDEAFVCQSYLEKSKIEKGKIVGPFARHINQKV